MAVVQTLIGNIKGPAGDTGPTGATGAQGPAATIEVGTVSTSAYGTQAEVTNSGSSSAAVFDFVIPQGAPGETVTDMSALTLNTITTSSASFPSIATEDVGRVIFGKINKFFSDVRSALGNAISIGGRPDDRTDLNSLTTVGVYNLPGSGGWVNGPSGEAFGVLTVLRGTANASFIEQMFSVSGATRSRIYNRSSSNGGSTWTDWQKLGMEAPVPLTASAAANVTINRLFAYQIGKLVWVAGSVTTSSQLSSGTNILTGLPGIPADASYTYVDFPMAGSAVGKGYINKSGEVKAASTMAATSWSLNFCYITD